MLRLPELIGIVGTIGKQVGAHFRNQKVTNATSRPKIEGHVLM